MEWLPNHRLSPACLGSIPQYLRQLQYTLLLGNQLFCYVVLTFLGDYEFFSVRRKGSWGYKPKINSAIDWKGFKKHAPAIIFLGEYCQSESQFIVIMGSLGMRYIN